MSELFRVLSRLESRMRRMEMRPDRTRLWVSKANVSNPPTDAELDSAFGQPAAVGHGLIALVNDNNADSKVYLVAAINSHWWYVELTEAV